MSGLSTIGIGQHRRCRLWIRRPPWLWQRRPRKLCVRTRRSGTGGRYQLGRSTQRREIRAEAYNKGNDSRDDRGEHDKAHPKDKSLHPVPRCAITNEAIVRPVARVLVIVIVAAVVPCPFPVRTRLGLDVRLRRIVDHAGRPWRVVHLGIPIPQGITGTVISTQRLSLVLRRV